MQIVIDDEKIIDLLETEWGYEGIREDIARVIRENGIPLPKGHGRLIDADAYAKKFDTNINGRIGEEYLFAPTIIEADEAESEDKE